MGRVISNMSVQFSAKNPEFISYKPLNMSTIIGLSFGNTTSSIAYTKEGLVEVIANPDGDRVIPSMLSYAHGDEFHGLQAKHQIVRNSANTIAYFRDFVGVKFSEIDPTPCQRFAKPILGSDGFVAFEINGEVKSVDDIITRQFDRIHHAAHDYIGKQVDGVVLALPYEYSESQRTKLVELASKAGLPVIQVIGELTAALLAHVSRDGTQSAEDKLFVVADFGGSRSDSAVISVNSGVFTIIATHSDTTLGGRLLDSAVLAHLAKEFEEQYKVSPLNEPRAVAKLMLEAESLRRTLSNSTTSQFGIDSVASGFDFSGTLNRLKFEVVARQVFTKFAEFVNALLAKASVDSLAIDEVLLVGGVSWTPKVASVIANLFDEHTIVVAPSRDTKAIDPDELIARGCAIQGSLVSGLDKDELREIEKHLQGIHLAKAVGIVLGDKVIPILKAHTLFPTKKTVDIEGTADKIQIAELETEIRTTVHKPEPKTAEAGEDDESDWGDSEDDEFEERELVYKPTNVLAEIDVPVSTHAKVTLYLTAAHKLQVAVVSGDKTIQGTI